MPKPNNTNSTKPDKKPEIIQIVDKMCSEKKPEMLKELFEKMGLTKEKVIEMLKSADGKEKLMKYIMIKLEISNADKEEMLQNLSQMGQPEVMGRMMGGYGGKPGGMGGHGGKPGGMGGHGHGHGGGPPMGGH